jgi:hypothetical protein
MPLVLFGLGTTDGWTTVIASKQGLLGIIDYTVFAQAQINLAHALDQANAVLSGGTISGTFSFDQDTPVGRIAINSGGGDTTYTQGTDALDANSFYLLTCDVDGNDTYNCAAGANAGILNPVSICLDLAGNDIYASLDDPADAGGIGDDLHSQQGTGRWGNGILVDYAGDDTYTTSMAGQGSGFFGWGLLYDVQGNDAYTGTSFVQGSAFCGVGILHDSGGADAYTADGLSQGFGDIWGLGVLSDKGADPDTYFSKWDGATGSTINVYSQGAAAGFGGDAVNAPVIWDGGIGLLVDSGGDDSYSCGVRGQGHGYWFSTGVFDDRAGNDTYEGDAFIQGSGSVFGSGIMLDRAGNDLYNSQYATRGFPLEDLSLGGGTNYALGWFLDGGGDDNYTSASYALGCGVLNALAYFCDMGNGIDHYNIPVNAGDNEKTLGRGYLTQSAVEGDVRETQPTLGLFVDCGGADLYDANFASIPSGSIGSVAAGDNLGWYRFGYTNDFTNNFRLDEFGAGLDGTGITGFEFP